VSKGCLLLSNNVSLSTSWNILTDEDIIKADFSPLLDYRGRTLAQALADHCQLLSKKVSLSTT